MISEVLRLFISMKKKKNEHKVGTLRVFEGETMCEIGGKSMMKIVKLRVNRWVA